MDKGSPHLISKHWVTELSTVPPNIVEFQHSFGFNCKKLFNVVLMSKDYIVFSSGNLLHYYHIGNKTVTFRRSSSGGGIGFILKNPSPEYKHLTVLENGDNPLVIIYQFPEHKVVSILEKGAQKSFTCATYSPDGTLLATQAGSPDYMLTIWNWKKSTIILRAQSFQNDVLNVAFSEYNPILLTTCGLGHVKFWKMARTFTGLKLKGDLGRFGKTEICDVYAVYMLFDEKVISSCEWGNMLVWEAGLVKLEVCRKGRKPCHGGPITQITMHNGEVTTVGMDGYVRIWFWETVELADPPDDDRFVEIEPTYEFRIGDKTEFCECRALIKIKPQDDKHFDYYAQDGNGGIWECNLDTEEVPREPVKIFSCHGGRVIAGAACPVSNHFVSFGEDGRLAIYDYIKKRLIYQKKFSSGGTGLMWLPLTIDPSGLVLLLSFKDGVIREIVLDLVDEPATNERVYLVSATKPHCVEITAMAINPDGTVLVSGAKDKTIFVYTIEKSQPYVSLIPVGFVDIGYIPNTFNWRLKNSTTCITGTFTGEIVECELPLIPRDPITPTFRREEVILKIVKFSSVKSHIRREIKRMEVAKRKEIKRQKKMEELDRLKQANPGIQIDEESALADSEEDEPEEPLFIPKIPNPIIWLKQLENERIWISMSGYDAGYIYEMVFGKTLPVRSTIIDGGDDIEIHTYLEIEDYLLFGMQNGCIRVNSIKTNFTDLSDYWLLAMHDNLDGVVSEIFTSGDRKYLFSVGYDGNVFSYKWNGPQAPKMKTMEKLVKPQFFQDLEFDYPSLEQMKIKNEQDRQNKIANDHKATILGKLAHHREDFKVLMKRNRDLPPSQRFTQFDFEIDERVTENLENTLETEMALVRRKIAFDVEKARLGKTKVVDYFIKPLENMPFQLKGIRKNVIVNCFRFQKLDENFEEIKEDLEDRIRFAEGLQRRFESLDSFGSMEISIPPLPDESFFAGIDQKDIIPKFSKMMLRLLQRYRKRKVREIERFVEWEKIKSKKPDPNKNHIDDIRAIELAEKSIGDYKLKMNPEYEPSASENVLNKFKHILEVREQLFNKKKDFNDKLIKLRKKKKDLYAKIDEQRKALDIVHQQIPISNHKFIPDMEQINLNLEEPEINLVEQFDYGCNMEIKDIIMGTKSITTLTTKPTVKKEFEKVGFLIDPLNTRFLEKIVLPDLESIFTIFQDLPHITNRAELESFNLSQTETPPWEIKFRYFRVINKLIEQDEIIKEVEACIDEFDELLQTLKNEKIQIRIDAKLLEMHLISLNQELSILKDCEQLEQGLLDKAHAALTERNSSQITINALNKQIDDTRKSSDKMAEQIKVIQNNFLSQIKGNKFFDFLRRIFKKKYKPPKPPVADDESEESSESDSTTSEEEDGKSEDSQDMAPIRLDENFCPTGLDRKIYDWAFTMRNERHGLEQAILNNQKLMEDKKKEMEEVRSKMKKLDEVYVKEKNNLLAFRREKQQVLNKVTAVVILRMDQLNYMKEGEDINDLKRALLFDLENISKLNIRVGQLALETLETKRLHRVNIVHLQRMTKDCKFMNKQILVLQDEIKQAMYRKFGMVVNLDQIEEITLRKYIFSLKLSLTEEKKVIEKELEQKRKILADLQKELIIETQKGSEKLNILTILQEEKNYLMNVLYAQTKTYQKLNTTKNFEFSYDLDKLKDLAKHQAKQIEFLEREVRTLRFKSTPLQMMSKIGPEMENTGLFDMVPEDQTYSGAFSLFAPFPERSGPDPYKSGQIMKIVSKFVMRHFGSDMNEQLVRKYSTKVAKYLGYVAVSIQGEQTNSVLESIVDGLETIIPKKYLINVTKSDFKCLFQNVLSVFNYEKAVVRTEDVIKCIVLNAFEVANETECFNKTQVVICEVFKEMIEALTLEDFRSPETEKILITTLSKYREFLPKCISIDKLVIDVTDHARKFLCDDITQIPIRKLADAVEKGLQK